MFSHKFSAPMKTKFQTMKTAVIGWGLACVAGIMMGLSAAAQGPSTRLASDVVEFSRQPVAAHTATAPHVSPEADETREVARLEALPAVQIPIEDANLASAIKIVAQSAGMNHIAPDTRDFSEPISMTATINPWRLLQSLADRYRFTVRYQDGMWLFSRESRSGLGATRDSRTCCRGCPCPGAPPSPGRNRLDRVR